MKCWNDDFFGVVKFLLGKVWMENAYLFEWKKWANYLAHKNDDNGNMKKKWFNNFFSHWNSEKRAVKHTLHTAVCGSRRNWFRWCLFYFSVDEKQTSNQHCVQSYILQGNFIHYTIIYLNKCKIEHATKLIILFFSVSARNWK